jgi:hypothetical protein
MNNFGKSKEAGNTLLSVLFFFLFIAVLVALIIKIMPVYYNNMNIQHILNAQTKAVHRNESPSRVRYRLGQRLNVQMFSLPAQDITIQKTANGVSIRVKYKKVVPLLYNASLLLSFNDFSATP